jgi:hypothetical protein|nr:hypothetical protein [uncultured Lachnoclostridium sp.]
MIPVWFYYILSDLLYLGVFIVAVLIIATRYAPYTLVICVEWFLLSGKAKGFPVLKWWQLLIVILISIAITRFLFYLRTLLLAIYITSAVLVIGFITTLMIGMFKIDQGLMLGVIGSILIVIGSVVVAVMAYLNNDDDIGTVDIIGVPVLDIIIRIIGAAMVAFSGYAFGGLFLPGFLGMEDKIKIGMYNDMGLPIALGCFVVSFIAFSIIDKLEI